MSKLLNLASNDKNVNENKLSSTMPELPSPGASELMHDEEEDDVEVDERFVKFEFQPFEYVDLLFYCFDYAGKLVEKCSF